MDFPHALAIQEDVTLHLPAQKAGIRFTVVLHQSIQPRIFAFAIGMRNIQNNGPEARQGTYQRAEMSQRLAVLGVVHQVILTLEANKSV